MSDALDDPVNIGSAEISQRISQVLAIVPSSNKATADAGGREELGIFLPLLNRILNTSTVALSAQPLPFAPKSAASTAPLTERGDRKAGAASIATGKISEQKPQREGAPGGAQAALPAAALTLPAHIFENLQLHPNFADFLAPAVGSPFGMPTGSSLRDGDVSRTSPATEQTQVIAPAIKVEPVGMPHSAVTDLAFALRISPQAADLPKPICTVEGPSQLSAPPATAVFTNSGPQTSDSQSVHSSAVGLPATPGTGEDLAQNYFTRLPALNSAKKDLSGNRFDEIAASQKNYGPDSKQPTSGAPPEAVSRNSPRILEAGATPEFDSPQVPATAVSDTVLNSDFAPVPIFELPAGSVDEPRHTSAQNVPAKAAAVADHPASVDRSAAGDNKMSSGAGATQQENSRKPLEEGAAAVPPSDAPSATSNPTKNAPKGSWTAPLKAETASPETDRGTGNAAIRSVQPDTFESPQIGNSPPRQASAAAPAASLTPEQETKSSTPAQAARQISFQLAGTGNGNVNVLFTEKAGKVDVTVRTPDRELAKSMQSDLGDLVDRLEHDGLKTETWIPNNPHPASAAIREPASSAEGQGDPHHSGSQPGGQQNQQGQSDQKARRYWFEPFEETLSGTNDSRSEKE